MPQRTAIDLNTAARHHNADLTAQAVDDWNATADEPQFYLHGDVLSRVVRDENAVRLAPYTLPALQEWLSRIAVYGSGDKTVPPPEYIGRAILARPPDELPELPRINRVVDVPVSAPTSGSKPGEAHAPRHIRSMRFRGDEGCRGGVRVRDLGRA